MTASSPHEVTAADTAIALGSGDVAVLATPRLLAWMEGETVSAARAHLGAGQTSVGIAVRLRHRRPSKVGQTITVTADLKDRSGERLVFLVEAADENAQTVAVGEIDRVIVSRADFG